MSENNEEFKIPDIPVNEEEEDIMETEEQEDIFDTSKAEQHQPDNFSLLYGHQH